MSSLYNYFFSVQPKKEKYVPTHIYNWKRQELDPRDYQFEDAVGIFAETSLPSKYSLRNDMPPVLDQGRLGSCVSNATANALQFCLKKEHEMEFAPSRLYMYYYTRLIEGNVGEDTGCVIRDAMKELRTYGGCHESLWPYDISKFTTRPSNKCTREGRTHLEGFKYLSVRQNEKSIKTALVNGFPVIIGVEVYESFESPEAMKTGDLPMPDADSEQLLGGHCMNIISYDDETRRFGLQNSWGTGTPDHPVGDKGYFTIPYEYVLNKELAGDFWMVSFWK